MNGNGGQMKIGVLGLTLEFYEERGSTIREGREAYVKKRLLPLLSKMGEVHFDRAVYQRDAMERVVMDYEQQGVDVLLVLCLTYSTSLSALPALQHTRLPIVIWNTQELFAVDQSYGSAELTANHGVHGTFDLCNVLVRSGVEFGYVTRHADDADCGSQLEGALRAAAAAGRMRRMKLGLIGYPFPGMGDFGLDMTHLAGTLGCAWKAIALTQFNRYAAEADSCRVEMVIHEYRDKYDISENIAEADLEVTARSEVAMRRVIEEHGLGAYSYQFLSFGEDDRSMTVPFVAASRLMGEGIGFGGEGDLIAAAYTAVLNWLSKPAGFSEIFTIDFGENAVLLSHMGEANVAMHRRGGRLQMVKRQRSLVPIQGNQLALVVNYEPGPATVTALTIVHGGRWRIIASPVEILDFGPLEHLEVPHAKAAPKGDIREFLTAYARAGGPHHMVVCFGDARERIASLAMHMGAEYVEV